MTTDAIAAMVADARAAFGDRIVTTDADRIAPWLTDWRGRYHGISAALFEPADAAEVAGVVALAGRHGVALVPQGGNTSMVGGATPPADGSAVLLSLRRLNRIRQVSDGQAVAEAGVILQHLHEAAAAAGQRFPLTLGARGSATIGGLVSTNAGGTQVLRWGNMRRLVLGIEAVLPDGTVHGGLAALPKDNRGYDLTQLLVGAEGTLGIVTAATLRLVPAIAERAVAWAGIADPQAGLDLLRRMQAATDRIESFEIIPADTLALAVAHLPGARAPLSGQYPWQLLIEAVAAPGELPPAPLLEELLADGVEAGLVADAVLASSEAQAEAFWTLRDSLSAAEKSTGPAVQHDISVPVDTMPRFMVEAAAAAEARFPRTHATAFGHLGDGNVHFHVRAPVGADPARWYAEDAPVITRFVHDAVTAAGGSISAEHGIGQMKRGELERLGPPARLAALRGIKSGLDPLNLFNPGKLVSLAPRSANP
ncbi:MULTISPECIES: FAD-binding oxidoreductase [Sphingomonas]|jgi:FAD/FMN-containing dehydrogenase|uniref:Hydroxyacid dehydrogenase n=1 Tax=Sphingomonas hankookensis TaxID=563996 RepID=A0ABR5YFK5_9SPHN|nr:MULTISPECIES: FAD-binding oxidoreductase [Sphingomonas]KZE18097.1 hydroxyacid dehydrogenase [Sphingomonas hankookensis]PZT93446.1 MAG: FAD-binding oxidoreductase [Sphingomonas sp.]RSV31980.1 FAD-binding oxidoreductase [Sphingomonas sp. ABOLH]